MYYYRIAEKRTQGIPSYVYGVYRDSELLEWSEYMSVETAERTAKQKVAKLVAEAIERHNRQADLLRRVREVIQAA